MSADTLLSTKLRAPPARQDQVARPRLIIRLVEGLRGGRRLTLVSAPPGFGKTTLIREWMSASTRSVAWLALDDGDNDPVRFVRYVAAALGLPPTIERPEQDLAPQEHLVALINALAAEGTERSLVLDDYQAVLNFTVHDLVNFLLAHQPPCFHLIIGTREDPPLPLARLRGRNQVTEVRERDLRFTLEETTAFLNRTLGLSLSSAAVASLASRTEGWITALQLAGLALGSSTAGEGTAGAADHFVDDFAGDDRYIVDYLVTEVLGRQPEPVADFLRQTAILDRLCAPLCTALTGREDSQAMLEHLEAANLFLSPLDNRREWWRYHVLFAEMLRLALPPRQQSELHRKAAAWCEEHAPDLAVRYARRAAELAAVTTTVYPEKPAGHPLIEPLSERELEVLRLVAAGLSNQDIADRLIIAPGTVKRHINNIFGKLQVGSRTQAVAVARDLHLL